ncbi:MAG: hypothetical protein IH868_00605 [Chloroflexi bacterium]|nr:hypothetical protein [Chloroflexota bacterium]
MAVIPIKIKPEKIHIISDRRLAFQVITAFGVSASDNGQSSRVLKEEGDRKLVEFVTPLKLGFGLSRNWVTNEWVEMSEPNEITFNLVPGKGPITGGLKLLSDRFVFEVVDNCTDLTYESTFGIRWSIFGWVFGKVFIERYLRKHMRDHLLEVKPVIEARAARSRVYAPCEHGNAQRETK